AALHLASLTVRLEGLGEQEALWKLGGVVSDGEPATGQTRSDPGIVGDVVASLPGDPALVPIFQAISERRVIRFRYRDDEREVEPWRLDFHRGRWYLTGYDRNRDGERNFRLDRMAEGVTPTDIAAEQTPPKPAADGPLAPWEIGAEEQTMAKLRVDEAQAESAARQLGPGVAADPQPDGSVVFTVPVAKYDAFRTFVLGFLDHAEVLEPEHWRQDIVTWLQTIAGDAADASGGTGGGAGPNPVADSEAVSG
ncbi:MAG: WYL domain-containing protein, partial [Actinomycetota bacterium]